mmetsp:Transcript_43230/g.92257  ORF Transcript_43230/g.92257 Transcript_43230/m.92257 type:complete len:205 (-) Transcript_43230:1955-2569(-)
MVAPLRAAPRAAVGLGLRRAKPSEVCKAIRARLPPAWRCKWLAVGTATVRRRFGSFPGRSPRATAHASESYGVVSAPPHPLRRLQPHRGEASKFRAAGSVESVAVAALPTASVAACRLAKASAVACRWALGAAPAGAAAEALAALVSVPTTKTRAPLPAAWPWTLARPPAQERRGPNPHRRRAVSRLRLQLLRSSARAHEGSRA